MVDACVVVVLRVWRCGKVCLSQAMLLLQKLY